MDNHAVKVSIQDVNPLNEKIFENGWMYVGHPHGRRDLPYFAPYFTNECANPGLSRISRIVRLDPCKVADLLTGQIKLLELPDAPSEQHRSNWKLGLLAICARAKTEKWDPRYSANLFYLDRPESFRSPPLTKQIHNDTNPLKRIPPTIPIGFTLKYDELLAKSSWSLDQPPRCPQLD